MVLLGFGYSFDSSRSVIRNYHPSGDPAERSVQLQSTGSVSETECVDCKADT